MVHDAHTQTKPFRLRSIENVGLCASSQHSKLRAREQACAHTHTHIHTHTHTHSRTCARARTPTHTHPITNARMLLLARTPDTPANGLDALSVVSPCCLASCSSFNTLLVLFCYPTRVDPQKPHPNCFLETHRNNKNTDTQTQTHKHAQNETHTHTHRQTHRHIDT